MNGSGNHSINAMHIIDSYMDWGLPPHPPHTHNIYTLHRQRKLTCNFWGGGGGVLNPKVDHINEIRLHA